MIYLVQFVVGLLLAAAFDWVMACAVNAFKLETQQERRQAFLVWFAFHGPWAALAFPLFLSGLLSHGFARLGMKPELADWAALPTFGVIGGLAILLIHQAPSVRAARAAVGGKMKAANNAYNEKFGAGLGFPPGQNMPPKSET